MPNSVTHDIQAFRAGILGGITLRTDPGGVVRMMT